MFRTPDPASPAEEEPSNAGGSVNTGCLLPAALRSVSYRVITRAASSCASWLRRCFSIVSLILSSNDNGSLTHPAISDFMSNGTGSGMLFRALSAASDSLTIRSEASIAFSAFPSAQSPSPRKYPCALSAASPSHSCCDFPTFSRIRSDTLRRT